MSYELSLGIVIPAWNAASTLAETLRSVEGLRRHGALVVVVDGGSTDDTRTIAARYDAPVIEDLNGLYASLNRGFRSLASDWLTWINADDILYSDTVRARLAFQKEADISYGRVDFIDDAGRFMHSWLSAAPRQLLGLYRGGYSPLLQQGTLFRRRVFETVEGFDETYRFVGDADFFWRAIECGFRASRETFPPVAAFRLHRSQLSQRYADEMRREHDEMVRRHGGRRHQIRSTVDAVTWRLRNASSYLGRALRRHQLDGRWGMPGSYSVHTS